MEVNAPKISKILFLGCGVQPVEHRVRMSLEESVECVRLDCSESCKPDVLHDLNDLPLPFEDEEFDEVHAYEVLEHLGTQGDYKRFFEEFTEYWRILKPNGFFVGSVPNEKSIWAWGDPGHRRVLPKTVFLFLNQDFYAQGNSRVTDYKNHWKRDFKLVWKQTTEHKFFFGLQKNLHLPAE